MGAGVGLGASSRASSRTLSDKGAGRKLLGAPSVVIFNPCTFTANATVPGMLEASIAVIQNSRLMAGNMSSTPRIR